MTVKLVKDKYEKNLMSIPNVVSVGTARKENKEIIKVFVKQKKQGQYLKQEEIIPGELESYEIDIEEIGEVTAQNMPE